MVPQPLVQPLRNLIPRLALVGHSELIELRTLLAPKGCVIPRFRIEGFAVFYGGPAELACVVSHGHTYLRRLQ